MTQSTLPRSGVRLLIIEDHALFAESLDLALTIEGYDVRQVCVATAEQTPAGLLAAVLRQRPRIALLDLDLGAFGDGGRLITPLAKAGVNVVVITASTDRARWGAALRSGARKVLSKSSPLVEIRSTVRRIHDGLPVMEHAEREELMQEWARERSQLVDLQARMDLLTVRERQVLAELMKGRTVREIASTSVVSEATVRTQVKAILAKLDVSSQLAAVGLAHQLRWVPPQPA